MKALARILTLVWLACAVSAAHGQIVHVQPVPEAEYYWDTVTSQFLPCVNESTTNPSPRPPVPHARYGWNSTISWWVPFTTCGGGGTGTPGTPALSLQFASADGSAFQGDADYLYNPNTHSVSLLVGSQSSSLSAYVSQNLTTVNGASPQSIYSSFTTTGTVNDALSAAISVPNGSIAYQTDAITGYVDNYSTTSQAVAVAGYARNRVSGGSLFGANFAAIDATGTPAAFMKTVEADTQPQAPLGAYTCEFAGGDLCQVGVMSAFFEPQAGTFPASAFWATRGQVGQWGVAYNSSSGAASLGAWFGSQSATVFPSDSQLIRLDATASGPTILSSQMWTQASTGSFILFPPSGGNFLLGSGNMDLQGGTASFNGAAVNANSTSNATGGVTSVLNTSSGSTSNFAFLGSVGGTTQWPAILRCQANASATCIWAGPSAPGNSQPSQQIRLDATSSTGATNSTFILGDVAGNLELIPTSTGSVNITQGALTVAAGGTSVFNGALTLANYPSLSCLGTSSSGAIISGTCSGPGSGVTSLNGLAGALTLGAGSNITITPSGSTITIAATAASAAFSSITSGTNSTAAMVVGTGASLTASGSGVIAATIANALNAGGVGSVPYQSTASATSFVASPTTSGHTFALGWTPSGTAIAPAAIDLATYLASPAPIGTTTASTGRFSGLADTGLLSQSCVGTDGSGNFVTGTCAGATYRGVYAGGTSYSYGDRITDSAGDDYTSLVSGVATNTGNTPSLSPADWQLDKGLANVNFRPSFDAFDAALNACAATATQTICWIPIIGDSTGSFGVGNLSSYADSLPWQIAQSMWGFTNGGGFYLIGNNAGTSLSTLYTSSGSITTDNQVGPYQTTASAFNSDFVIPDSTAYIQLGNTGTAQRFSGDTLTIWANEQSATSICTMSIDGGSATSYTIPAGTPGTLFLQAISVTPSVGHYFRGSSAVGGGSPCHTIGYSVTTGTTGVRFAFLGHGSARSGAYGSAPSTQLAPILAAMSPAPVAAVISLGINDMIQSATPLVTQSTYTSSLSGIIGAIQAVNPNAAIQFWDEHNVSTAPVGTLTKALIQATEINLSKTTAFSSYFSFADAMGSEARAATLGWMYTDGTHCSAEGCHFEAALINDIWKAPSKYIPNFIVGAYSPRSIADYPLLNANIVQNGSAIMSGLTVYTNGSTTLAGIDYGLGADGKFGMYFFNRDAGGCGGGRYFLASAGQPVGAASGVYTYAWDTDCTNKTMIVYGPLLNGIGSAIASAATIAPTSVIQPVNGTAAISTMTPPPDMSSTVGSTITLLANGAWSLVAGTTTGQFKNSLQAVTGNKYPCTYDGTLWWCDNPVSSTYTAQHFIGSGTTPAVAFGTGAGTTPTSTSITGSDFAFTVAFTAGITPAASSPIFTVTFNTAYTAAPHCTFSPGSLASSSTLTPVYKTTTTTTFVLNATATALAAGAYSYDVTCGG